MQEVIWYAVINRKHMQEFALDEIDKINNPLYMAELNFEPGKLEVKLNAFKQVKQRVLETYDFGYINEVELKQKLEINRNDVENILEKIKIINGKISDNKTYIDSISHLMSFQSMMQKIKYDTDFETKRNLVNMFIENVIIDFDEVEEIYSIKLNIKLPKLVIDGYHEANEHIFCLNKGQKPNFLDYDAKHDKFYEQSQGYEMSVPYEKFEKDGKLMFRNFIGRQASTCPPLETSVLADISLWANFLLKRLIF